MTKTIASLLLVGALFESSAAVILPPGSQWEYTFTDPSAASTWTTGTGGSGWQLGNAPFGNSVGGDFGAATTWPEHAELWVRTTFDLTGFDLNTVDWNLGVDNGFDLYINGTHIAGHNAEGFASRWEYIGSIAPGLLNSGNNWVAVALEDHGGLTAFDMQILADPTTTGLPEAGSTLVLFGIATSALAFARRKTLR